MNKKFWIVICLFSIIFNCNANEKKLSSKYILVEHTNPIKVSEEIFYDKEQVPHFLDEYIGDVVVINFWATWCTFCTSKMKSLDKFKKTFKTEAITFLAISEDFKGIDVVESFYKSKEIKNLELFIDKKSLLMKSFNVSSLPTAIIINHEGYEVARITGVIDWNEDVAIKKIISKHIKNNPNKKLIKEIKEEKEEKEEKNEKK